MLSKNRVQILDWRGNSETLLKTWPVLFKPLDAL